MLFKIKICRCHQGRFSQIAAFFIFCLNYDPGLTMLYYMAMSDFALEAFIGGNMTLVDTLEITASSDQEFGECSNLNEVYE